MILSHALRAVSKVSATNVSYITNATRKGNGTFSVSVNSGDTILGFVLERTGDTVSLSGFSNNFLTNTDANFYLRCYATTAASTGTFTSTLTGNSTTMGLMVVFRDSILNPASVSFSTDINTTNNPNVEFAPLAGFVQGDIALAVGCVDNGSYVSSTPLLSSLGFTGIASARVGTSDGDVIASYLSASSSGSIPSTTATNALNTSETSLGLIVRIPKG
jgi:hypothetical protein